MDLPKTQEVEISKLIPAGYNPRTMSDFDFAQLVESIKENGFIEPITINSDYTIISGHMRTKAATEAGLTHISAIIVTVDKDEERALNIKMNRTRGTFDAEKVAEILYGIRDKKGRSGRDLMDLTGFTLKEQSQYLDMISPDEQTEEMEVAKMIDEVEREEYQAYSRPGDVYILGNSKVVCGDSTNMIDLDLLLGEEKANMVWTDPPYNVNYESSNEKLGKIKNDNMDDAKFQQFMDDVMVNLHTYSDKGAVFYICSGWQSFAAIKTALDRAQMHISECLIWVKNRAGLHTMDYPHKHEQIISAKKGKGKARAMLYGWKPGDKRYARQEYNMDYDVWEADLKASQEYVHPTEKPDWLVMRAIKNSSKVGDIVLNLFTGSGSALIACEKTGRKFRGLELDPRFVDVIVRRWMSHTGEKAILLRDGEEIEPDFGLVSKPDDSDIDVATKEVINNE